MKKNKIRIFSIGFRRYRKPATINEKDIYTFKKIYLFVKYI